MNKDMKQRGFTLIELLVVISIIAILTTLLMANFVGVRQRGRDAQRKSNLYNIQAALELFKSDAGLYPYSGGTAFPACNTALTYNNSTYMSKVPCDPQGGDYTYVSTDGTSYTLYACLENESDSQRTSAPTNPNPTCTTYFVLTNP